MTGLTTIDWEQPVRREKQLCSVTELFRLQLPKPTSFLTQCYDWEVSEMNQAKPGKVELNVFLETRYLKDLDRIDGEPTVFG